MSSIPLVFTSIAVGFAIGASTARWLFVDRLRGACREFEWTHVPGRWTTLAATEFIMAKTEGRPMRARPFDGVWWRTGDDGNPVNECALAELEGNDE